MHRLSVLTILPALALACSTESTDDTGQKELNTPWIQVEAGDDHTCAIKSRSAKDGLVVCWGSPDEHRLGVPSDLEFFTIAAGYGFTCGVTMQGIADCWGEDSDGQASPGYTPPADTADTGPGRYSALAVASVSAGWFQACGITNSGEGLCWGNNAKGQSVPPDGYTWKAIATGHLQTCGISDGSDIVCWGWDHDDMLDAPREKSKQLDLGKEWACAVSNSGKINCWGSDFYGGLTNQPTEGDWVQVSVNEHHACAVDTSDKVTCWGKNDYGETDVPDESFVQVSAGGRHSCGVTTNGRVRCWGDDLRGQSTPPSATGG